MGIPRHSCMSTGHGTIPGRISELTRTAELANWQSTWTTTTYSPTKQTACTAMVCRESGPAMRPHTLTTSN